MDTVVPGLYASEPNPLPFAPSLDIRAFLLPRDEGNLLVYSAPSVAADASAAKDLGGISRQYLNHWHESSFGCDQIARAMQAPLFCHEDDGPQVARTCEVEESFSERAIIDDDFELIPTPGHTPGATAYLWDSGEHRYLFTGDTVYLNEGEWIAAVLDSSDRSAYVESLALIRELDFDLLVPWAATGGQAPYAATDSADIQRRIGAILERVRRGDDH